jgi:hypothetical protein
MNFDDFINGRMTSKAPTQLAKQVAAAADAPDVDFDQDGLDAIIEDKPRTKYVRKWFKEILADFMSPEERMFQRK